jgi:hypothetical protein
VKTQQFGFFNRRPVDAMAHELLEILLNIELDEQLNKHSSIQYPCELLFAIRASAYKFQGAKITSLRNLSLQEVRKCLCFTAFSIEVSAGVKQL